MPPWSRMIFRWMGIGTPVDAHGNTPGARRVSSDQARGDGLPLRDTIEPGPTEPTGATQTETMAPATSPVISVKPIGQLANRMIQHMVAISIAARVPGARISRIHLPEWGIDEPAFPTLPQPVERLDGNLVSVDDISERLRSGAVGTAEIVGYAQNVRNILPPDAYRSLFAANVDIEGFGPNQLLISLRMLEILSGNFPPYVLVPIAFYRDIVDRTGLEPVFFGQLSQSAYLDDLRKAFPEGKFVDGSGVIRDFETIRRSKNILISVSTFAWAAAWLSHADRIIMPLTGMYNPVFGKFTCQDLDLVPRDDPRYEFYLFPINVAVPAGLIPDAHRALENRWRQVSVADIDAIFERRKALKPSIDDYLTQFDEEFYLRCYTDLGRLVADGALSSGKDHYVAHGFKERRMPFYVDPAYLYRYPDAAESISNGEYLDLIHYHAARGAKLGYTVI